MIFSWVPDSHQSQCIAFMDGHLFIAMQFSAAQTQNIDIANVKSATVNILACDDLFTNERA